jgi:hypothetical protein
LLGQQGGNRHALALAAGQRAHVARRQVTHVHRRQGFQRNLMVVAAFPVAVGVVRVARREHALEHRVGKGVVARLGEKGALARQVGQRPGCQGASADVDGAAVGLVQACQCAQQSALAGAVAADDAPAFARLRRPVEALHQGAPGNGQAQVVGGDGTHLRMRCS